jgi:Icc-related predicted phosphoesterase
MKSRSLFISLGLIGALAACQSKTEAPAPAKKAEAVAEPAKAEPAQAAAQTKADPACVGAAGEGAPQLVETANGKWERNGSTVTWKEGANADGIVLGAITDIKDGAAENIANLKQAVTFFTAEKVDAIVVAGDSGETEEHITAVLDVLAAPKVPVFIVIGNRESKTVFNKAVAAASIKYPHVFNLNQVRRVDTPAVDLVSLPGYFNPDYLHAEDGCRYFGGDIKELETIAAGLNSPGLLVSHGGPKQAGKDALDYTSQGNNVGHDALLPLFKNANIPYGIFGNIHEAGGTATDLAGAKLAAGAEHPALYLNPGPVDSIRWPMNDGTESTGMAAVMSIKAGKASYKVERFTLAAVAPAK